MLWELLPFHNCSFSAERIDYQPDSFSGNRNNACNIHFIHLSVNRLLPTIDEIRYITKLTYVTVIELSETKLDKANLSSELEIEGHDLVRSDRSRGGEKVACFVKTLFHIMGNLIFAFNAGSIFIEIFLPKSKPVLSGILYRPPDKYDFINYPKHLFSNTNIIESQKFYLFSNSNINLQPKYKEIFGNNYRNTIGKEIPHFTRSYLEFCFTHSLEQIITRPTRVTDQTATVVHRILTNLRDKISQSDVKDLCLTDHDLIYCIRKTSVPKSHKHNEIFVRRMKRFSGEKYLKILRQIIFLNYLTYTSVNDASSDFLHIFVGAKNFIAPVKRIRVKVNSKPRFNNHIVSVVQRRDKL